MAMAFQSEFSPPRSPTLKPSLARRLFFEADKKTSEEVLQRVEAAVLRKRLLLQVRLWVVLVSCALVLPLCWALFCAQATVEQAEAHNERVKATVYAQKASAAAAAAHKMAALNARLEAAAERRRNASPATSPVLRQSKMPFADGKFVLSAAMVEPVPITEEEEKERREVEWAMAASSRPLHEELAAQLEAVNGDYGQLTAWMKEPATIGLVAEWLGSLGVERKLAKRLLALVYLSHDASTPLDDSDAADKVMAREASRFKGKLWRQLRPDPTHDTVAGKKSGGEAFAYSFTRARRFYAAWSAQDVPKQAHVVDEALTRLRDAIMRRRVQHAHDGTDPIPPEDLLAQVKALAGDAAEAEARARFNQAWAPVSRDNLEVRVREVATRAMWDAIRVQVASGQYDGLWGVLGELQQAMSALVAHSERAREELADRFDAAWIEQQATAGCLSTEQVHGLLRYVTECIASWQAPIDDEDARTWAATVEETIAATGGMPLPEFIIAHLVNFLATAIKRLGKVYERVLALSAEVGGLRETAAALDAAEEV